MQIIKTENLNLKAHSDFVLAALSLLGLEPKKEPSFILLADNIYLDKTPFKIHSGYPYKTEIVRFDGYKLKFRVFNRCIYFIETY